MKKLCQSLSEVPKTYWNTFGTMLGPLWNTFGVLAWLWAGLGRLWASSDVKLGDLGAAWSQKSIFD